jgi:putative ABC transport system ATP-binding protein
MTSPSIVATAVTKSFSAPDGGTLEVLRGVSLQVEPGEFVAIVGQSGSGKSTLLHCLSGLEPVTSGDVRVGGVRLDALSRRALTVHRREHIGFVFQSFNLIASLTARQNVELSARLAGRSDVRRRAEAALAEVGMTDRADFPPGRLSGGQQQRVALARVVASSPGVVVADEPTGALDSETTDAVLDLLRRLASGQRSVVMVTHDLEAAARADRVVVLRDGAVHEELVRPTAEQVLASLRAAAAPFGAPVTAGGC